MGINGARSVRLENGTIEFKNLFKQLLVPFYNLFWFWMYFKQCCKLWRFLLKKYQDHIPCSFAYKLVCVDDKFSKPIILYRGENAAYKFIEAILEDYE